MRQCRTIKQFYPLARFLWLAGFVFIVGCGVDNQRDISLGGAKKLFQKRLIAKQVSNEETRAQALKADKIAKLYLPKRRRTLQIRLPAGQDIEAETASMLLEAEMAAPSNNANISPTKLNNARKALQMAQFRLDKKRRSLLHKQQDLANFNKEIEANRKLEEQAYRFEIEKILLNALGELETNITTLKGKTLIGNDDKYADRLVYFGRNRLAKADEFVDLRESFFFIGNDIATGISLGRSLARSAELKSTIKEQKMSVNFAGIILPVALRSLAQSIDLPILLSKNVQNSEEQVFLEVQSVDALDILDAIIDNHDIALAYDKEMGIARFYTIDEFSANLEQALDAAKNHNELAKLYQELAMAEYHRAKLYEFYEKKFNSENGDMQSIDTIPIMDEKLGTVAPKSMIAIKDASFAHQRVVNEKRKIVLEEKRVLENEIYNLQQSLMILEGSVAQASAQLDRLLQTNTPIMSAQANTDIAQNDIMQGDREQGDRAQDETALRDMDNKADKRVGGDKLSKTPNPSDKMTEKPMIEQIAANEIEPSDPFFAPMIVQDSLQKTSQPVYTDRFKIFYQKPEYVKEALLSFFENLYMDIVPIVETAESAEIDSVENILANDNIIAEQVQAPRNSQKASTQRDKKTNEGTDERARAGAGAGAGTEKSAEKNNETNGRAGETQTRQASQTNSPLEPSAKQTMAFLTDADFRP
ncbi:MAG: hypothetical protein OXT03_04195, partial [Alphaproteobacteria bacterium]|nr:hypothetical protein [Alphaproteobacteria bacterium]